MYNSNDETGKGKGESSASTSKPNTVGDCTTVDIPEHDGPPSPPALVVQNTTNLESLNQDGSEHDV